MVKFIPDHLKTKKMCKHVVKNIPAVKRHVSDQYKIQQMCDKAILENSGILGLFLINKAFRKCVIKLLILFFVFHSERYKAKQMFDRVVSKNPFMLVYCHSKTQKICNEAVDGCAKALKFIPDWFVTMKMLEMFHEMLEIFHHTNDEIIIFDEDLAKSHILLMELVLLMLMLTKLTLSMINIFMKMVLNLLFLSDFWIDVINLKTIKHLKKI